MVREERGAQGGWSGDRQDWNSGAVSRAHHGGLEPQVRGSTLCCGPDTLKPGWLGNSTGNLLKWRYLA